MRSLAASVLAIALGVLQVAPAHAETTACTVVASVPVTLSVPGHYCLTANLDASGASTTAITVSASNVVLDCNDHRLRAATAGNTGAGVHLEATAVGAVVRNCRIEDFYYGISSAYSGSPEPRAARLLDNRITRANLHGIFLYGSGHLVEGNTISDGQRLTVGYPTGIYLVGGTTGDYATGNVIRGNTVQDFRPPGPSDGSYNLSIGISVAYQRGAVVEDNTIHGLRSRTGGGAYGIVTASAREMVIQGNRVLSVVPAAAPFDGGNWAGIFLQGTAGELASNRCVDNVVGHFNNNYNGCSATGNQSY
ncbi:MAG: NosD domain-containing protein [Arenimonas sp.]